MDITNENLCPVLNLPITQKPEWTNLVVAENYHVTFRIVGTRILVALAEGDMEAYDVSRYYELREKVIQDYFEPGDTFVELKDYSKLSGMPSRYARKEQTEKFQNEEGRLIGFIGYNCSFVVRGIFKLGIHMRDLPFPFRMVESYEHAIKHAIKILDNDKKRARKVTDAHFYTRPEWSYSDDNSDFSVTFLVIKPFILKSVASGYLMSQHVKPILDIVEIIVDEGFITDKHIRIADYSKVTGSDRAARKLLANGYKEISRRYKCNADFSYICGANALVKIALVFIEKIINSKLRFVDTAEQALIEINNRSHISNLFNKNGSKNLDISFRDIDALVQFIGSLAWHTENEELYYTNNTIPEEHPLKDIYDALRLIQLDLHVFMEEKRQREIQLQQAKEKAEFANKAKNEFLANISHEIRTPMNGILGMTDLTLETELNDEQRRYLETVKFSAESLLHLMNDLLDVSKMEAGKFKLVEENFNVRAEISTTIAALNTQAMRKSLPLELNFGTHVPAYLIGDATRIRQVLTNLISNAIKFTQKGTIGITIELLDDVASYNHNSEPPVADGVCGLYCSVSDHGIGIPPDKIESIFETFQQVDGTLSRKHQGAGLGLAICKQLVHMMGGEIWVESTPGQGSTFYFTIYLKMGQQPVSHENTQQLTEPGNDESHSLHILIAEDEPINQQVITRILEKSCHVPHLAEHGNEAIKLLKKQRYDLILMDIQMPEVDGITLTERIRSGEIKGPNPKSIPIIALTAHIMQSNRDRCMEVGMNGFLSKPIKKRELLETIGRFAQTFVQQNIGTNESGQASTKSDQIVGFINTVDVLDRLEQDQKLLFQIWKTFLNESPVYMEQLRLAIEQKDMQQVERIAHKLKGATANVGADGLRDVAWQIEQAGQQGKDSDADAIFPRFSDMYEKAIDEIKEQMLTVEIHAT
ncbi:response regulator [candidate division KSB1 bacterium]|nr:response regulator [candidate division KSB1 bacterium]